MKEHNPLVLIVDDDESIRIILSSLVRKEGFEVLVADQGETALKMMPSASPDLRILGCRAWTEWNCWARQRVWIQSFP
jgi:DNA-binding response OmpR family regulator